MSRLNNLEREELQNIFCYFTYNKHLTDVVPAILNSAEFKRQTNIFYKEHIRHKFEKPTLYQSAVNKWRERQLFYYKGLLLISQVKSLTKVELNRINQLQREI